MSRLYYLGQYILDSNNEDFSSNDIIDKCIKQETEIAHVSLRLFKALVLSHSLIHSKNKFNGICFKLNLMCIIDLRIEIPVQWLKNDQGLLCILISVLRHEH